MKRLDSFKGVTLKVEELHEVEGGRSIPTLPTGILLYLYRKLLNKD
jgi:hypothetical protein